MNKLFSFIGILATLIAAIYGFIYLKEHYQVFNTIFQWFGILSFFSLLVFIILKIRWRKKSIAKGAAESFAGGDFINALNQFTKELPNPSAATNAQLIGQGINRLTRIGIFTFFMALLPSLFLLLQTVLLRQQNELFTFQNMKVTEQTELLNAQNQKLDNQNELFGNQNILIEADRRSSLIFLMSNILDKVDEEIKEQQKTDDSLKINKNNISYKLSKPLIGRIIALSRAFKPYRILEGNNTLSDELVSPERGQLFISLMKSQLDSSSQNTIVANGDFSNAIIREITLYNKHLSRAKLNEANLSKTQLVGTNLRLAKLSGANFNQANLSGAKFGRADLSRADLSKTQLHGASLANANLSDANLVEAYLIDAELGGADLNGADLSRALLNKTHFGIVNLSDANLSGANLSDAKLYGANLSGAKLHGVINLTIDQLKTVDNLYKCKNLDSQMEAQLRKEKPCLFTEEGCN